MQEEFIAYSHRLTPSDPPKASRDFLEAMKLRRSVRDFSSRPVDREILLNAIATAGSAPSGANTQPWFFALIESQSHKDKIREAAEKVENQFYHVTAPEKWLSDLKPFGTNEKKPFLSTAPAIIAVFSKQSRLDHTSYYPLESTGIAVGLLLTSLHFSGLSTLTHTPRPMYFINSLLGLDESFRPFMLIVVGYPEENARIPVLRKKELTEICTVY